MDDHPLLREWRTKGAAFRGHRVVSAHEIMASVQTTPETLLQKEKIRERPDWERESKKERERDKKGGEWDTGMVERTYINVSLKIGDPLALSLSVFLSWRSALPRWSMKRENSRYSQLMNANWGKKRTSSLYLDLFLSVSGVDSSFSSIRSIYSLSTMEGFSMTNSFWKGSRITNYTWIGK